MASAPNFMSAAIGNATRIQNDPVGALGVATKAFAASGELGLKLSSLIQMEEQAREAAQIKLMDNVLRAEQQSEVARHNKQTEAVARINAAANTKNANTSAFNAETNRKNYNLNLDKYKFERDAKVGSMLNLPVNDSVYKPNPNVIDKDGVDAINNDRNSKLTEIAILKDNMNGLKTDSPEYKKLSAKATELEATVAEMDSVLDANSKLPAEISVKLTKAEKLTQLDEYEQSIRNSKKSNAWKLGVIANINADRAAIESGIDPNTVNAVNLKDMQDYKSKMTKTMSSLLGKNIKGKGTQSGLADVLSQYVPGVTNANAYDTAMKMFESNPKITATKILPFLTETQMKKFITSEVPKLVATSESDVTLEVIGKLVGSGKLDNENLGLLVSQFDNDTIMQTAVVSMINADKYLGNATAKQKELYETNLVQDIGEGTIDSIVKEVHNNSWFTDVFAALTGGSELNTENLSKIIAIEERHSGKSVTKEGMKAMGRLGLMEGGWIFGTSTESNKIWKSMMNLGVFNKAQQASIGIAMKTGEWSDVKEMMTMIKNDKTLNKKLLKIANDAATISKFNPGKSLKSKLASGSDIVYEDALALTALVGSISAQKTHEGTGLESAVGSLFESLMEIVDRNTETSEKKKVAEKAPLYVL